MAFTVTATESGSSAQHGVFLLVQVLTSATETGGATAGAASGTGAAAQGSLTPNFSGSRVAFAISADGITGGMGAAATNNVYDSNNSDGTDFWSNAQGHYTGTVTASSALTYGGTNVGADHSNWCAYEIPQSGGAVVVDGSSPALASTLTLAAITTASFTPPAGSVLCAMVIVVGSGSGTGITVTMTDTSGLGLTWTRRAISSTSDNFQPSFIFTTTVPGGGPAGPATDPGYLRISPPGLQSPMAIQSPRVLQQPRYDPGPPPWKYPEIDWSPRPIPPGFSSPMALTIPPLTGPPPGPLPLPFITGLAGGGTGYFVDNQGNPRLYLSDNPWGLPPNAGRWNGGNWQADYDNYCISRGKQGFTAIYTDPLGNTVNGGAFADGRTYDGIYPFNSGSSNDPSSGLNNSFWTRIDYLLASAAANGLTIFMNIAYCEGGSGDMDVGALSGKTSTQYQDYGTNLGNRYKGIGNIVWMVGNDYFGSFDSAFDSILTGLRGAGDTHAITVHNMPESTSRKQLDNGTATTWGASNALCNWVYTYNCEYFGVEQAYAEASPLPVVIGDGYFYQGTGAAFDRSMRQELWWAFASGARGSTCGSEGIWQWGSAAAASVTSENFYQNVAGKIRLRVESLAKWHLLIPDTGNALVTGGRGTRVTSLASGGGGGQYESAFTNSYVAASLVPDGTLALLYLPNHTTITIDQTKLGSGYTATWIDPVTGATSAATTGSTYNSTAKGNNSVGDPDWALALQSATPLGGLTIALTTAQATAASNALTIHADNFITLTTAQATAASNAVTPTVSVTVALTTAQATANANAVTVNADNVMTLTTAQATANANAVTPTASVTIALTTAAATAAANTFTIQFFTENVQPLPLPEPPGLQSPMAVLAPWRYTPPPGPPSAQVDNTVALTTAQATAAANAVTPVTGTVVTLTTAQATVASNPVGIQADNFITLTTAQATVAANAVSPLVLAALTTAQATAAANAVQPTVVVVLTTAQATANANAFTISSTFALTTAQATANANPLGLVGQTTLALTTAQATAAAGVLAIRADNTVALTTAQATAASNAVTPTVSVSIALATAQATVAAGVLVVHASSTVTLVTAQATAAANAIQPTVIQNLSTAQAVAAAQVLTVRVSKTLLLSTAQAVSAANVVGLFTGFVPAILGSEVTVVGQLGCEVSTANTLGSEITVE